MKEKNMLTVEKTKIRYRNIDGPEVSNDSGLTWYFTFRVESEFREMWNNHTITGHIPQHDDERDAELELFGETLDDPIPDDLADMILDTRL